ncbi:MAG: hypothetical protein WKF83_03270 [Nocardioidaceae bacterium]
MGHPPQGARRSTRSRPRPRCSRPASRSSTCSPRTCSGGKIGLFGGAGVGKTVLIQEMIARVATDHRRRLGVRRGRRAYPRGQRPHRGDGPRPASSDRPRWSSARWTSRRAPGSRVALSALTMAEYFRDVQNQDVLLFIDNIFRFTQAGSEVSTLLGRMPSAVGYQPTLADEMGVLQERITSTRGHSITSMQAIYVPADDYTDPAPADDVRAPRRHHRAVPRDRARMGIYPAVDPLTSTSRILDPRYIGEDALRHARPGQADPAAQQGAAGHHRDPRCRRAVRGGQGHRSTAPGVSSGSCRRTPTSPSSSPASRARTVPLEETIEAFNKIADGDYDHVRRAGLLHVRRSR